MLGVHGVTDVFSVLTEPEWQERAIEEASGKAEYVRAQRGFAERAQAIRRRLVADCDRLLTLC